MTQNDLKRILAYSTISQLGYMFLALGIGSLAGIAAAMFHLFTHAFFKALLFLGAGSVMHAMGGVIDIRRFGGLRKIMPITCVTFAIGSLALAGIFPFAGFWSKDAIIGAVHDQVHEIEQAIEVRVAAESSAWRFPSTVAGGERLLLVATGGIEDSVHAVSPRIGSLTDAQLVRGQTIYTSLYYVALFTAFLTALYTFRAFFLTFFGDEEIPHEADHHAHESPRSMWVPLAILAACAVGVGFVVQWSGGFAATSVILKEQAFYIDGARLTGALIAMSCALGCFSLISRDVRLDRGGSIVFVSLMLSLLVAGRWLGGTWSSEGWVPGLAWVSLALLILAPGAIGVVRLGWLSRRSRPVRGLAGLLAVMVVSGAGGLSAWLLTPAPPPEEENPYADFLDDP